MKNNNYTSFFKTKPKKVERYIRCRKCGGNMEWSRDFPAEYGYLLSSAALSAYPKNTVIADMVIENILHRKSYRKISKERYIPMNPKDFYGYRRKTVAVLYERMRLLGVWEEK